jgi:hypothetical protein
MPAAKQQKPAAKPAVSALAPIVDELGALEKKAAPWKAKLARIEELRKLLRASAADLAATATRTVAGEKYMALIGACETVRTVDVATLETLISTGELTSLCTVTLTALEAAKLAPEVVAQVVTAAPTGTRALKVFERNALK